LAAPNRCVSDLAGSDHAGFRLRGESGLLRARRGSGSMELPATARSRHRNEQIAQANAELNEDKRLLAALIRGLVGDRATVLSNNLIDTFGTLPRVLKRFEHESAQVPGWPADVTNLLADLSRTLGRVLRREALPGPIVSTAEKLLAYLHHDMAQLTREVFRVLFLDSSNRLLADRIMWEGTVAGVQIHPREVVRNALDLDATALIFVHNHPSGDPSPSHHDVSITKKLIAACEPFDVTVHDHIIIARGGFLSMRSLGLFGNSEMTGCLADADANKQ
jgi:DNA repair protein RadC